MPLFRSVSPPFRWTGSKRRYVSALNAALPDSFSAYVEHFCGSASLYFSSPYVQAVSCQLRDANPFVVETLNALKANAPALVVQVQHRLNTYDTKEKYIQYRKVCNDRGGMSAADFLYFNVRGFNGLWRTNKSGKFNVPYGDNRSLSEANLLAAGEVLAGNAVSIVTRTFTDTLLGSLGLQRGRLHFLDPPYIKGFAYNTVFPHEALASAVRQVDACGEYFMLTYDDCPVIREMYDGFDFRPLFTRHQAGGGHSASLTKEVIITNY